MNDSYSSLRTIAPGHDDPVVLLSIDPEWADAILTGEKRYEYRRTPPREDTPFRVLLYATKPTQAIVGAAWIDRVIEGPVEGLAENTTGLTPHEPDDIVEYFEGKETGSALSIQGYIRYDEPVELGEVEPPQNFQYIRSSEHDQLLDRLPYERGIPHER